MPRHLPESVPGAAQPFEDDEYGEIKSDDERRVSTTTPSSCEQTGAP